MNSKRIYYLLIALIVLVNGSGIAALYYGNKILAKQTTKLTDLKVQAASLEDVQRSLVSAKKDIVTYSDIENVVKTVVPQEKDQAQTIREIVKIAGESNIVISSIAFPTSTLGSVSTGSTPAPTGGPTSNTQTKKVDGINGVESLEITVTSDSTKPVLYSDFISFLQNLEQNRRTSQVGSINIIPDTTKRNYITFTMTLNVYIKK